MPPDTRYRQQSVRFDADEYQRILDAAQADNRSVSSWIRNTIARRLDQEQGER